MNTQEDARTPIEALQDRMDALDKMIFEETDAIKHGHIYEKIKQADERIDRLESRISALELRLDGVMNEMFPDGW